MKINDTLGVYYFNPVGMSTNPEHDSWKKQHEKEIFMKYLEILKQKSLSIENLPKALQKKMAIF